MQSLIKVLLVCLLPVFSIVVKADQKAIEERLVELVPGLEIKSIEKSEIEGLYRVVSNNSDIIFTNSDASYFLAGQLFSTTGGQVVNLSEQRKGVARAEMLAAVKPDERIIFPAKDKKKASVTIFTDIDCGYCRKLHREVPKMNELGIEVNYVAYPRAGIGSPSYDKIVSAWCADDRLQAMTDAKAGKDIPMKTCENPVADQYNLGMALGVSGTPAIVLEDGTLVPGYVPAEQLAKGLGIL